MVGESGTSQQKKIVHRYYKCVSVKNHKGCDKKTVKKDWIEDLTIKMIKQIIFDDKLLNDLADEIIKADILPGDTIHITALDGSETQTEGLTFNIEKGDTSHQFDAALSEAAPAEVSVE
jgi:hypothetical protein